MHTLFYVKFFVTFYRMLIYYSYYFNIFVIRLLQLKSEEMYVKASLVKVKAKGTVFVWGVSPQVLVERQYVGQSVTSVQIYTIFTHIFHLAQA